MKTVNVTGGVTGVSETGLSVHAADEGGLEFSFKLGSKDNAQLFQDIKLGQRVTIQVSIAELA